MVLARLIKRLGSCERVCEHYLTTAVGDEEMLGGNRCSGALRCWIVVDLLDVTISS